MLSSGDYRAPRNTGSAPEGVRAFPAECSPTTPSQQVTNSAEHAVGILVQHSGRTPGDDGFRRKALRCGLASEAVRQGTGTGAYTPRITR
ncbi:hypothetical protein GCM10027174_11160 [Salinifilum aidingensis]